LSLENANTCGFATFPGCTFVHGIAAQTVAEQTKQRQNNKNHGLFFLSLKSLHRMIGYLNEKQALSAKK
jgi:hypothetical protein